MVKREGQMNQVRRPAWLLLGLFSLALLVPVAVLAYLGTYSRYMSDDYCTAWTLTERGFIQSQVYWYTSWSGRYTFTFLVNVMQSFGPWITRILPGLSLVAWITAMVSLVKEVGQVLGVALKHLIAIIIAAAAVVVIMAGVPNTFQSIYWLTGISTYTIPLILFLFYLYQLAGRINSTVRQQDIIAAIGVMRYFLKQPLLNQFFQSGRELSINPPIFKHNLFQLKNAL